MSFVEGMLVNKGVQVTIDRDVPVTSYATIQRFTRSQDPNVRESLKWGLILASSELVSGDIFTVDGKSYLVQSVGLEPHGEYEWYGVQCNATFDAQRFTETANDNGDITHEWTSIGSSKGWVQVVTARLRVEDPGLVDGAKYTMQVPKSLGLQVLDRLVFSARNYQVESVDDVGMEGVARVQLAEDYR